LEINNKISTLWSQSKQTLETLKLLSKSFGKLLHLFPPQHLKFLLILRHFEFSECLLDNIEINFLDPNLLLERNVLVCQGIGEILFELVHLLDCVPFVEFLLTEVQLYELFATEFYEEVVSHREDAQQKG
jgi:hypothetical protein